MSSSLAAFLVLVVYLRGPLPHSIQLLVAGRRLSVRYCKDSRRYRPGLHNPHPQVCVAIHFRRERERGGVRWGRREIGQEYISDTRVSDEVRERRIRTCRYGLPFLNVRRYSLTPTMEQYQKATF